VSPDLINNPIMFNDPFGYWVFGIGIEVGAGVIIGGEASVDIMIDGEGNIFLLTSWNRNVAIQANAGVQGGLTFGAGVMDDYEEKYAPEIIKLGSFVSGALACNAPPVNIAPEQITIGVDAFFVDFDIAGPETGWIEPSNVALWDISPGTTISLRGGPGIGGGIIGLTGPGRGRTNTIHLTDLW
jgi:hypothetical protein